MSFVPIPAGAPGAAVPSQAMYAGGTDGTNLRGLLTDTTGRQKVLLYDANGNAITSTSSALDENLKLIGGTAVDVNSGNKSAGTQRVVLATDQPILTNKLPAQGYALGSDDVLMPQRIGNKLVATGVSATTALFTAPAATFYYVTAFLVSLRGNAALVSGNALTVTLQDSVDANFVVFDYTVGPTTTNGTALIISPSGFYYRSSTAASSLSITFVIGALSAGALDVVVCYGFTQLPV